ncbi:MerR family transcriptional regulator [Anaerovorax odorimutans]|uniref:MerR family transcriptional regulator n=1 Tax=Anaerovorax odorimutans TaxID=109327 RepID=A0ABT1RLL8_9FIRM|nr:MerR family transcriptional regulator [Anaerovorax odorimutans]MCQ4636084.1 MerR family transcriptional regulator [Anaerovorax odorimutans]
MKTISQVAELTGVSTRTLQYYDEIGLLKPSGFTSSGYRLYDDSALQELQQILFFKELGFKLKEIKELMQSPQFDRTMAFKRQKQLLLLKRNRIDRLIELLSRLEKGEKCVSFKEFDLSEYIEALECFRKKSPDDIIKYWGSVENFNQLVQKLREDESDVAQLAIKHFGSVEKYTQAMKHNMEHFSEIMAHQQKLAADKEELLQRNDAWFLKLTADMQKSPACGEVQDIVREIIDFTQETAFGMELGEGYWDTVIESYSGDVAKEIVDKKYGDGAAEYVARALRCYFYG